jgi:hypothetical protein
MEDVIKKASVARCGMLLAEAVDLTLLAGLFKAEVFASAQLPPVGC